MLKGSIALWALKESCKLSIVLYAFATKRIPAHCSAVIQASIFSGILLCRVKDFRKTVLYHEPSHREVTAAFIYDIMFENLAQLATTTYFIFRVSNSGFSTIQLITVPSNAFIILDQFRLMHTLRANSRRNAVLIMPDVVDVGLQRGRSGPLRMSIAVSLLRRLSEGDYLEDEEREGGGGDGTAGGASALAAVGEGEGEGGGEGEAGHEDDSDSSDDSADLELKDLARRLSIGRNSLLIPWG